MIVNFLLDIHNSVFYPLLVLYVPATLPPHHPRIDDLTTQLRSPTCTTQRELRDPRMQWGGGNITCCHVQ